MYSCTYARNILHISAQKQSIILTKFSTMKLFINVMNELELLNEWKIFRNIQLMMYYMYVINCRYNITAHMSNLSES